ncbi:hypothetical protein B9Z55_011145 [Caenorhabditis nigoni]|uniref:F-box domain-containing protein n=1 Tax=Caenorhabditis nigoni TaxID=1611254 RepID=A0A2G5UIU9_9PELO|nr:hypothetical protein B9Z55_011145 [Caenorhabditis nigoni]
MTDQRFPFLRLPDDLRLKVLQTTEHLEIFAFSFTSKKAYSIVQDLRLPISHILITIEKRQPQLIVRFGYLWVSFLWRLSRNNKRMTNLNDLPARVEVSNRNGMIPFIWSDQGKSIAEWIQHLCSILQSEKCCGADFHVYRNIEFDIPTLRNVFPKIGSIDIVFRQEQEANEHENLLAQNFLKAFLPDVQKLRLEHVRLGEHFSIGDFGMANLKELKLSYPRNLRVDDLLIMNAENITIAGANLAEISLRDLNRFFKLWMKGSNPKLKGLKVWWETNTIPDLNVMLKGLKADEAEIEEGSVMFKIRNSNGVLAGIRSQRLGTVVYVEFQKLARRIGGGGGGIEALGGGIGGGGGGIGASERMEVESKDRRWWRWNRRIGADGGGIGGSELVEVESKDRRWWRWNRRIRAGGGGIGGSELVEVESEDQSWWRWNRRIGAGGGGIEGSEVVEVESEDQSWWRWDRRIGGGGGGIGGSELMEVESEDRSWWRWNRRIGGGGGGIGGSELVEVESEDRSW